MANVPDTRLISTTAPLQGGGDLTVDRTLSLDYSVSDFSVVGTTLTINSTSPNSRWIPETLLAKVR